MNAKKRKLFRKAINEALKPDSAVISISPVDYGIGEKYISIRIDGIEPETFMNVVAKIQETYI